MHSVDTEEEAEQLLMFACQTSKITGEYFARELVEEQTLDNLQAFATRLQGAEKLLNRKERELA